MCLCVSYQHIHHVGFVVSQCLDGMKNINTALLSQHLTHHTDAAEHPTASSSITEEEQTGGARRSREEERGAGRRRGEGRGGEILAVLVCSKRVLSLIT